jgi:hypothetical protein
MELNHRTRRELRWRQTLQSLEHPYDLASGAQAQAEFEAAQVVGRAQGFSPLIIEPEFHAPIATEPNNLYDSEWPEPAEYFARRAREFAQGTDGLALFNHVSEVAPKGAPNVSMSWTFGAKRGHFLPIPKSQSCDCLARKAGRYPYLFLSCLRLTYQERRLPLRKSA